MNAEDHIIAAIELMTTDKSLVQPWKNYAISDARRALALYKMANGSMYQKEAKTPDTAREGVITVGSGVGLEMVCTCGLNIDGSRIEAFDCPVHGF